MKKIIKNLIKKRILKNYNTNIFKQTVDHEEIKRFDNASKDW
jgi:hypothetical protein